MANNVVEYIIKIRDQAKGQVDKIGSGFKKANADATKLAGTSKKLVHDIADLRGELAAAERRRSFAKTEADIRKCNKNISYFNKELKRLERLPPNGFFSRLGRAAKALTGLSLRDMGIAVLATKVRAFTKESIKLFDVQAKAEAQVKASLQTTGLTAGRTFEQLAKQASDLQRKTTYGDEAILKMQSVLLTYKKVRGEVLDKTTPLALDIATKTNTDLTAVAQKLGRVLDAPAKNMRLLRSLGISFTKEQEEGIKKLVEAGNLQQAQLLILTELQSKYGGAAEAAALAGLGPMQQLRNLWNDFKEKIGGVVLSVTNRLIPSLKAGVEWALKNGNTLKTLAKSAVAVTATVVAFKVAQFATLKVMALFTAATTIKKIALVGLTKGLTAAKVAVMAFNKAMKANIIGIVVAGIVAAVAAIKIFSKRTSEAAAARKKEAEQQKKAAEIAKDYYAQEKSWLDQHFEKLEKTNAKSRDRIKLVDELMRRYPGLNKELRDELINTSDLNKQKSILVANLQQQAIAEGIKGTLKDVAERLAAAELKRYKAQESRKKPKPVQTGHDPSANQQKTLDIDAETLDVLDNAEVKKIQAEYNAVAGFLEANKGKLFPEGFSGGFESEYGDGAAGDDAAASITSGGKSVKNFNITINDGLIKQVDNHFASTNESPETASNFLWELSKALQMILNDVNYAAS